LQALEADVQVPPIAGSATATTVESIPATDDPKIIAATTHRPCAERFARAGAVNRVQPARLSARIWCHRPDLRVVRAACHGAAGLAAAAPPALVTQRSRLIP
jgi:hypothetical protein